MKNWHNLVFKRISDDFHSSLLKYKEEIYYVYNELIPDTDIHLVSFFIFRNNLDSTILICWLNYNKLHFFFLNMNFSLGLFLILCWVNNTYLNKKCLWVNDFFKKSQFNIAFVTISHTINLHYLNHFCKIYLTFAY